MPQVIETFDSRQIKGDPPIEATFRYSILQVQDEEQAAALVYTKAPATYRGLEQDRPSLALQKLGFDSFIAELPYKVLEVGDLPGGGGGGGGNQIDRISEFDTTGATQHITQAISQVPYPTDDGDAGDAPELGIHRVINWNRDGVDGVDIVLPKLDWSVTDHFPLVGPGAIIDPITISKLTNLTGKTNLAPYVLASLVADPGELLFLGATGRIVTKDDVRQWEISFRFSYSKNRQNIVITPTLTVASKKGHEYLWILYKKDVIANRFVEIPDAAFVAKVYEEADFNADPILGVLI